MESNAETGETRIRVSLETVMELEKIGNKNGFETKNDTICALIETHNCVSSARFGKLVGTLQSLQSVLSDLTISNGRLTVAISDMYRNMAVSQLAVTGLCLKEFSPTKNGGGK
jgi:hypothetical protein